MDPSKPHNPLNKPVVKRSMLSPWNTAAASKKPARVNPASPQPSLIVSDIPLPSSTPTPTPVPTPPQFAAGIVGSHMKVKAVSGTSTLSTTGGVKVADDQWQANNSTVFSTHPKVAALQRKWEEKGAQTKTPTRFLTSDEESDSTSTDSSTSSEDEGPPPAKGVSEGSDSGEYSISVVSFIVQFTLASDLHLTTAYSFLPRSAEAPPKNSSFSALLVRSHLNHQQLNAAQHTFPFHPMRLGLNALPLRRRQIPLQSANQQALQIEPLR